MESSKVAPIYVKIDEYNDVLEMMNVVKSKMDKARSLLSKLQDVKSKEDHELNEWKNQLQQISHQVVAIDKALFDPR